MITMPDRPLTLRDLNRATLARQMLLEREAISVPAAIERLVGLQAQLAISPYIGLWTRLQHFQREHLAHLIDNHTVIKATLMRSTLHLFTADDYLRFRATLQRVMTEAAESISRQRGQDFDVEQVLKTAREFIAEKPRSFAEISAVLSALLPDADVGAMRYTTRTHLPLIQVPNNSTWSYPGNPKFTLAESWINQPIPDDDHFRELVFRYLAAFGPATVTDIQTWSGLSKLKDAVEALKPELVVYRDERKRELLDLPDMPLPDSDTPAPERFLPEYDNLLLSHKDRTRVIADEYRSRVYLPGLRVRSTILVDGFVRGAWKILKSKSAATLVIEPFASLTNQNREALAAEGEKLVRFAEPDAKTFEVQFLE
jgi:hypothetical protein